MIGLVTLIFFSNLKRMLMFFGVNPKNKMTGRARTIILN
jgi:hypothetical protein